MADNNPPALQPLLPAKPGDAVTADRWNDMQRLLRSEHVQHAHTGTWRGDLYDGAPITAGGLADAAVTTPRFADRAVTGAKVDPATTITVQNLTATGTVKAATLTLAEADTVALPCRDLRLGHSTRRGAAAGRALTDLKHGGHDYLGINDGADWTEGVKLGGDLQVTGKTTLTGDVTATAATFTGTLTAKSSAAITGALTVGGGLTVTGAPLTAKTSAAISGTLTANNGLTVTGAPLIATGGITVGGAPLAVNGLAVTIVPLTTSHGLTATGNAVASNGLTIAGAALSANNGLTVTGAAALNTTLTSSGAATLQNTLTVVGSATVQGELSAAGSITVRGRNVFTAEGAPLPRVLHGYITSAGATGPGYSTRPVDNTYQEITFTRPFKATPCVLVQTIGENCRDNAVVSSVSATRAVVYTGNAAGSRVLRDFHFLAIGPAD